MSQCVPRLVSVFTHSVVFVKVLPLLVELPHVHQPVLHLLQSPDLLPFPLTPHLDGRLTQHDITLWRGGGRNLLLIRGDLQILAEEQYCMQMMSLILQMTHCWIAAVAVRRTV